VISHSPRFASRGGQALTLLIFVLFAVIGLAAVLIDLGFARLTQMQMQTAAESVAREGLRFRDEIPSEMLLQHATAIQVDCGPEDTADPQWRDCARRWLARRRLDLVLDDDLLSTEKEHTLGAGPVIDFEATAGMPDATSDVIAASSIYKPRFVLNQNNEKGGDLVSGDFRDRVDQAGNPSDPIEGNDYSRDDFTPGGPGSNSFLARMRRSNEDLSGFEASRSKGPPLPLVFGRGLAHPRETIRAGITVRATSIAKGVPARAVGAAQRSDNILGGLPFVLRLADWEAIDIDIAMTATVEGERLVIMDAGSSAVGYIIDANGTSAVQSLGQQMQGTSPRDGASAFLDAVFAGATDAEGYLGVVGTDSPLSDRILGFGSVTLRRSGSDQFELSKNRSSIAPANATAALVAPLPQGMEGEILRANQMLSDALLVPATVR